MPQINDAMTKEICMTSTHRTWLKFINQECSFKTLRVTEYDNNLCCPRSQGFRGPWNELPPPKRLKTNETPAYLQFNFVVSIKCLFFLNMGSRIFHFDFQILKTQHSKINEMKTSRKVQSDLKHNQKSLLHTALPYAVSPT